MSIEDRAKAAAKDIKGKAQEAAGKLTGDREAQIKGKAKQTEAKIRQSVEDGKDQVKRAID